MSYSGASKGWARRRARRTRRKKWYADGYDAHFRARTEAESASFGGGSAAGHAHAAEEEARRREHADIREFLRDRRRLGHGRLGLGRAVDSQAVRRRSRSGRLARDEDTTLTRVRRCGFSTPRRRCPEAARRSVARSDDARPKGGSSPFAAYNSVIFPTRMSFSRRSAILAVCFWPPPPTWRQSFARARPRRAARAPVRVGGGAASVATRPRHRGRAVGDARADRDLAARVERQLERLRVGRDRRHGELAPADPVGRRHHVLVPHFHEDAVVRRRERELQAAPLAAPARVASAAGVLPAARAAFRRQRGELHVRIHGEEHGAVFQAGCREGLRHEVRLRQVGAAVLL